MTEMERQPQEWKYCLRCGKSYPAREVSRNNKCARCIGIIMLEAKIKNRKGVVQK